MKFERRNWTPEERERVLSGAVANEATSDICAAINRTPYAVDSVIHTLRREGHHIPPRYKRPKPQEVVRHITAREIADMLNAFWGREVCWLSERGELQSCLVGGKPVDSVRR